MTFLNKIVVFLNLLSVIKVSLLETVHFTNSANKLLTAQNYTTYKVEVPGSDPITIIEANSPVTHSGSNNFNQNHNKFSNNQHKNQDLKNTLSMTVTPDNYYNDNGDIEHEESVTNFNFNHNNVPQYSTMKTVYSPELLDKFLKDYADKLSTTDNLSQDKLNEIIKLKNKIQSQIEENQALHKLETAEDEVGENEQLKDDENRRQSSALNHDGDKSDGNSISERKNYNYVNKNYGSKGHNNYYSNKHPYNKNEGWVSLDAVPWSTSKISKWHSSAMPNQKYPNQSPYDRPSSNRPYSRPSSSGGGYYIDDNEDDLPADDDYYSNNNNNSPPSGYQYRPFTSTQSNYDRFKPPQDNFYQQSHSTHIQTAHGSISAPGYQNSHNSYSSHSLDRPRPWQPEIITDDHTPDFPRPQSRPHHNRPMQNDYHYSSGGMKQKLPATYPSSGVDGQWVLISTNKGYQFPKRHGQRAMAFKTQNNVNTNSPKPGIITAGSKNHEIFAPSQQHSGIVSSQQKGVKLTVLPLFANNNEENPQPASPNDTYGGVIEVQPSTETIEESIALAANANEANAISSTKKKKKKKNKQYNIMRQNQQSDRASILAAVGAGLVPATMALLAPIALG